MNRIDYQSFVTGKQRSVIATGFTGHLELPQTLFPLQSALSAWALRRGRAAIFADTGLGKSRMEIAWADAVRNHTGMPIIVLTPLAVAQQMRDEGAAMGIEVNICREAHDVDDRGINVTNYDRLHKFDPSIFGGVILDESSIIKHHDAKTFSTLTEAFRDTPYKLPASATPAPNDWTELGTHAEFLGICSRQEMLAEFFIHDGGDTSVWRLKGHARSEFWRWVASWGAMVRKPSDLGFDDSAYILPPLECFEHLVGEGEPIEGNLFEVEAQTLSERRFARRASLQARVEACAAQVHAEPDRPWVVWCDLNAESDALAQSINGAVEIRGSDDADTKERNLADFAAGRIKHLITKPSITGWGLNWQFCQRTAFVGVTDSFEAYYQALRRFWRFGQKHPVHAHLFASKAEGAVLANLRRKERDAIEMGEALSAETRHAVMAEVLGASRTTNIYNAKHRIQIPDFLRPQ